MLSILVPTSNIFDSWFGFTLVQHRCPIKTCYHLRLCLLPILRSRYCVTWALPHRSYRRYSLILAHKSLALTSPNRRESQKNERLEVIVTSPCCSLECEASPCSLHPVDHLCLYSDADGPVSALEASHRHLEAGSSKLDSDSAGVGSLSSDRGSPTTVDTTSVQGGV